MGGSLYYRRAIDSNILATLTIIGIRQSKLTHRMLKSAKDCWIKWQHIHLHSYHTGNMQLEIELDVFYSILSKAKSQIAGCFTCHIIRVNRMEQSKQSVRTLDMWYHRWLKHKCQIFSQWPDSNIYKIFLESLGDPQ